LLRDIGLASLSRQSILFFDPTAGCNAGAEVNEKMSLAARATSRPACALAAKLR
jgi:hypothetical protein